MTPDPLTPLPPYLETTHDRDHPATQVAQRRGECAARWGVKINSATRDNGQYLQVVDVPSNPMPSAIDLECDDRMRRQLSAGAISGRWTNDGEWIVIARSVTARSRDLAGHLGRGSNPLKDCV